MIVASANEPRQIRAPCGPNLIQRCGTLHLRDNHDRHGASGDDCDLAPATKRTAMLHPLPSSPSATRPTSQLGTEVCYVWKYSADPVCPYPACKYMHPCLYCGRDPQLSRKDAEHKVFTAPATGDPLPTGSSTLVGTPTHSIALPPPPVLSHLSYRQPALSPIPLASCGLGHQNLHWLC